MIRTTSPRPLAHHHATLELHYTATHLAERCSPHAYARVIVHACGSSRMVGQKSEGLLKLFAKADKLGGDLRKAWSKLREQDQPCSWGNAQRQYSAHRQAIAAAIDAAPMPTPVAHAATGAAAASNTKSAASTTTRTKAPIGKKTRATTHQVQVDEANKVAWYAEYKEVHKAATHQVGQLKATFRLGRGGTTYKEVAQHWNSQLSLDNPHRITEDVLKQWFKDGRNPGSSLKKRGPKQDEVNAALVAVMQTYARLKQLSGSSVLPSELTIKLQACVSGTVHEAVVLSEKQCQKLLAKTREGPDALTSEEGESICKRRTEALTYANVLQFFEDWEELLINRQFAVMRWNEDEGRYMPYVSKQKRLRILATDETHTVMTTALEVGGPRSHVYIDRDIGVPGRATVTNQKHTTACYTTNAAKEVLGIYLEFDSTATDRTNQTAHPAWYNLLPRPQGYYGHKELYTCEPAHEVNEKGGTVSGSFMRLFEKIVDPAYPNVTPEWEFESEGEPDSCDEMPIKSGPIILKTDDGPDRVVLDEEGLMQRMERHDRGYLCASGIPNGTSINAEQDQLYGEVGRLLRWQARKIIMRREKEQADVIERNKGKAAREKERVPPVNLANADIPEMIGGLASDPEDKRPFSWAFGEEPIGNAWDKVGTVSLDGYVTRKSLGHYKVRGGPTPSDASKPKVDKSEPALRAKHQKATTELERLGLDARVWHVPEFQKGKKRAPARIAPPTEAELELDEAIKDDGISGWDIFHRGAGVGMWSHEVIEPLLARIRADKAAKATAREKKDAAFELLQTEAQTIINETVVLVSTSTANLATLTRYVFQAVEQGGYSKILSDRSLMLFNLTVRLDWVQLHLLLTHPPKLGGKRDSFPSFVTAAQPELGSQSFAERFVAVAALAYADGCGEYEGYLPAAAPAWIDEQNALTPTSKFAGMLVGHAVCLRCADDEGGWCVATITGVQECEQEVQEGVQEDNFTVEYTDGSEESVSLQAESYAVSACAAVGSWVLMAKPMSARVQGKQRVPAPDHARGAKRASELTTEELRAELARRAAEEAEESD